MSLAYSARRRWEALSDRDRTVLLIVAGLALYALLALTAHFALPAGEGLS